MSRPGFKMIPFSFFKNTTHLRCDKEFFHHPPLKCFINYVRCALLLLLLLLLLFFFFNTFLMRYRIPRRNCEERRLVSFQRRL